MVHLGLVFGWELCANGDLGCLGLVFGGGLPDSDWFRGMFAGVGGLPGYLCFVGMMWHRFLSSGSGVADLVWFVSFGVVAFGVWLGLFVVGLMCRVWIWSLGVVVGFGDLVCGCEFGWFLLEWEFAWWI